LKRNLELAKEKEKLQSKKLAKFQTDLLRAIKAANDKQAGG